MKNCDRAPIKQPMEFSGKTSEIETFIYQVENYIRMKDKRFTDDEKKILFMQSLFQGKALEWAKAKLTALRNATPPGTITYANFKKDLLTAFTPLNAAAVATQKLSNLRQEKDQSVSAYNTTFNTLCDQA